MFVLPSRHEGHPKALTEAMSCGLMCIGTKVEGTREMINHGKDGLLCMQNPESLAFTIMSALKNERLRERCGKQARQKIIDHFSLGKICDQELQIYKTIIQKL